MIRRLLHGFFLSAFLCGFAASALAASGNAVQAENESIVYDRSRRLKALSGSLLRELSLTRDWLESKSDYREKREAHRLECRQELRRANKSQLLSVTARCIGSDLQWEHDLLLKQKQYVLALPDPSEPARKRTLESLEPYRDAIQTMIRGIEAGVFTSREDLEISLKKLQEKYRVPFHTAWLRFILDRSLSHAALIIAEADAASTGSGATLNTGRGCVAAGEANIREVLKSTNPLTDEHVRTALQKLKCSFTMLKTGTGTLNQ